MCLGDQSCRCILHKCVARFVSDSEFLVEKFSQHANIVNVYSIRDMRLHYEVNERDARAVKMLVGFY